MPAEVPERLVTPTTSLTGRKLLEVFKVFKVFAELQGRPSPGGPPGSGPGPLDLLMPPPTHSDPPVHLPRPPHLLFG
ncbi:hypothetical protein EYF80_057933 [Liparis tanakae]|uniref:Uncharacterized protein n=1 Tax=Liparis tanakae TaxID=230148 RepID=A0A4Z2ESZ0_9TELE|nr:hypothetical protein EYF80_057933 [Liparis tanakae]